MGDMTEPIRLKEAFVSEDHKVISWRGENYYTMEEALRVFLRNMTDNKVEAYFQFHETAQHDDGSYMKGQNLDSDPGFKS